jgi:biotin-(acetyl-CoA carboxylase) ligase
VILPDTNNASSAAVEDPICVPQRICSGAGRSGRHWARRPARTLTIEPLIDIVRETDHTVADGERAAAILVRALER